MNSRRVLPRLPLLLLTFFMASSIALTACGGGDSGTDPEDQVDVLEFEMLANLLLNQLGNAGGMLVLPGGGPGCLTISSFTDSDADGVPDDSDFVYSSSGCQFDIENGFGTTSGTVRVTDPGAAFGFSAALDDLAYTFSQGFPAVVRIITVNGQRQVTGSPNQATLTQNVQAVFTMTNRPTATVTQTWQAVFTPAAGSSVVFGFSVRVPDGGTVISGPMVWNQSGNTVTFSFSTPVPIRFDPACESPFPTAGEVHAQVVSGGPEGYVKVRWSSCGGEADVDWVEG